MGPKRSNQRCDFHSHRYTRTNFHSANYPKKANVTIVRIGIIRIEEYDVTLTSQTTTQKLINRVEISHVRARIDSVAAPTISVYAAAPSGTSTPRGMALLGGNGS